MERITYISIFSLFLTGSAIAFMVLYLVLPERHVMAISLSLSLLGNLLSYWRMDALESLCTRCGMKK